MTNLSNPINLYQPAEYLIELQGRLDPKWTTSFSEMSMSCQTVPGGFTTTTLRGIVADQSTLHGMLNHIRDLGIPLLAVECLSSLETKP